MAENRLEDRLFASAERVTPQRRLIASILQEQGGHLCAEEIHKLARHRHPHPSLATVYRTLRWLKESGLVRELRLNGDRGRYEIVRDEPHQHMVCLGCGKVIEFKCSHCADVHGNLVNEHGFRITGTRVKLLGYCADCQERGSNEKRGGNQNEASRYS